ncbi:MAG: hypothetical protein IKB59_01330 [Alphaproteobacteria bacterium]|nr:hypothetical protein [Alphaproteobacteria bacterium]
MKKIMNKVNFAIVGIMASVAPAMAANEGLCDLITKLGGLLKTLRTLAFIGAGFYIAQWAWGFIKAGDVKIEDVKDKGIGVLVGFVLLFSIGAVLGFLISAAGPNGSLDCAAQLTAW